MLNLPQDDSEHLSFGVESAVWLLMLEGLGEGVTNIGNHRWDYSCLSCNCIRFVTEGPGRARDRGQHFLRWGGTHKPRVRRCGSSLGNPDFRPSGELLSLVEDYDTARRR